MELHRDATRNFCPVCNSLVFGGVAGESDDFTIYEVGKEGTRITLERATNAEGVVHLIAVAVGEVLLDPGKRLVEPRAGNRRGEGPELIAVPGGKAFDLPDVGFGLRGHGASVGGDLIAPAPYRQVCFQAGRRRGQPAFSSSSATSAGGALHR